MADVIDGVRGNCPVCGGPVFGNDRFCISCGADVGAVGVAMPEQGLNDVVGTCSACGAPLYRSDSFCTNCGADIFTAPVSQASPQPSPQPSGVYGAGNVASNPPMHATPQYGNPTQRTTVVDDDADDPLARAVLVRITRAEAQTGCRKTITVDGRPLTVDVPAGTTVYTHVDIPGLGYEDKRTGARGPLQLSFHVV